MAKKETKLATGHDDPDKEVNIGIIITPMLDMAFQLLAFFVMTYDPSALEGHIDGKLLPPEKIAVKGAPSDAKPKDKDMSIDVEPEIKDAVLVIVKAVKPGQQESQEKKEGMPSRIMIKTPAAPEEELVADSSDTINEGWNKLLQRLREHRRLLGPLASEDKAEAAQVKAAVKLLPDGNLKYQYVVAAWDVCKLAEYNTIGFVPPLQ